MTFQANIKKYQSVINSVFNMMDPVHVETLCLIVEIGTAICWVSEDGFEVVMDSIGYLSNARGFRYRMEPFIKVNFSVIKSLFLKKARTSLWSRIFAPSSTA
jgi:hypothetical protein